MMRAEAQHLVTAINDCWACRCVACLAWVASQLLTEFASMHSLWLVNMETLPATLCYMPMPASVETPLTLDEAARLGWCLSAGHREPPCLYPRRAMVAQLAYRFAAIFPGYVWRVLPMFKPACPPYRETPPWAGPVLVVTQMKEHACSSS